PFTDAVRPTVAGLTASPDFDIRRVLQLYAPQEEMDRLVKEDSDRFLKAMAQLADKLPEQEPLRIVSQRYLDGPVRSDEVASELGHPDKRLQEVMRLPPFVRLGLGALASGGVVRRDQWESGQDRVVRALGQGTPLAPLDAVSRNDFQPEAELNVK